ncbi:hypothetical protein [Aquimarina agarilytica]|uniref:hypothetical protein n=1 Tax=Aquimarina agarilytica TaxID=1087449 RepID=UPI000289A276|nr:hypothetical protein [Aquimarina agarilytica]
MNNIFNLKRFLNLFRQLYYEKGKSLLLGFGLLVLISSFIMSTAVFEPEVYFVFRWAVLGLVVFGGVHLFAYILFKQTFKDDEKIASLLTLPNSNFEKWFFQSICVVIVSFSVLLLTFKGLEIALFYVLENYSIDKYLLLPETYLPIEHYKNEVLVFLIITYVSCIYYMFDLSQGSINKRIKIWIYPTIFFALNFLLKYLFFKDILAKSSWFQYPFTDFFFKNESEKYEDYLVTTGLSPTEIVTYILLPILLLSLAIYYFKLKEKEV